VKIRNLDFVCVLFVCVDEFITVNIRVCCFFLC